MKITKKDQKVAASKTQYAASAKHIMAAIDVLGQNAKNDPKAREAIANLSVVLLDLK